MKTLIQAVGRVWLIEESAAHYYAGLMHNMLSGVEIKAGLFDDAEPPYRANAYGNKADNGEVMVLPVSGPMMKADFCGSMGTASMTRMIQQANNDPSIQSIVLSMDTPGGSVDGTEAFANAVKASKKPVVVWAEMMASAGYWVGSSASEIIIAGETAMVGSIGTMAKMTDTSKKDEANGVRQIVVTATRSTDKNKSFEQAMQGKPEAFIAEFLDPMNNVFESAVADNRQGKINLKKEDVMTGKIYLGTNAIQVGLADRIGSLDYAIKRSLQLAKKVA